MSLKEALAGVKQGQAESETEQGTRKPRHPEKSPSARAPGKSSNDDYDRLTVYILKTTKRDAGRKWEDTTGKDMSELVEYLLTEYLGT